MPNSLEVALNKIPRDYFNQHPGGWPNEISTALIDAVYTIAANYSTKSGAGMGARVKTLRSIFYEKHPEVIDSLGELTQLDESDIRSVMGNNKVAPGHKGEKYKSLAVLQAANNIKAIQTQPRKGPKNNNQICAPQYIDSASDLTNYVTSSVANRKKAERAYTSVVGLGPVTFEYFLMLLGVPGIKADRMLTQFVRDALEDPQLSPAQARTELTTLYESWHGKENHSLIDFDHAIWLYQRQLNESNRSNKNNNQ